MKYFAYVKSSYKIRFYTKKPNITFIEKNLHFSFTLRQSVFFLLPQ